MSIAAGKGMEMSEHASACTAWDSHSVASAGDDWRTSAKGGDRLALGAAGDTALGHLGLYIGRLGLDRTPAACQRHEKTKLKHIDTRSDSVSRKHRVIALDTHHGY